MENNNNNDLKFGKIIINEKQIFYKRKYVFAFTNLRPFLPGHVLLAPTRVESKYYNLTETEVMELWISARNIADNLKKYYNTDSVQISIQDGVNSGQTVEHCHIHIIPIPSNYKPSSIDDSTRENRKLEEMEKEANIYKQNFILN